MDGRLTDHVDEEVLSRLLRLVHLLRINPQGLTEEELRSGCGVDLATVRNDLALLTETSNVPVYNEDDVYDDDLGDDGCLGNGYRGNGKWHLDSCDYTLPPPPLTLGETIALTQAVDALLAEGDVDNDSPLVAARERLLEALLGRMPSWSRKQCAASSTPLEQPENLVLIKGTRPLFGVGGAENLVRRLEHAISLRKRLRLEYRGSGGGERDKGEGEKAERTVDPYGLVYYWVQGAWYLVAFCHQAKEMRTFRVDRIRRLMTLEERFTYPVDFSLAEHFRHAWGVELGPLCRVSIRFQDHFNVLDRVRKEVAHRRDGRLIEEPDGSLLYTDVVAGLHEIRVWIRSFGESAEVLEPPELRESVAWTARLILERYGG